MKQYIKIIILCIGMVYGVNKTGTTAAKFLSIEVGSNAVGMGGAYTSIANDATAMYWNPAGLSFHDTKEVYFCLLYTSPSPRDKRQSRMPSSA